MGSCLEFFQNFELGPCGPLAAVREPAFGYTAFVFHNSLLVTVETCLQAASYVYVVWSFDTSQGVSK